MSFWRQNWWAVFLVLVLTLFYFHFLKVKKEELKLLSYRFDEMHKGKCFAKQTQEDLELRIASQSDPAWIEMVLMRDLGVVPEGFLKVHFKK